ncbi:hypothetical protein FE783_36455 [Paenibacillus mesophilus]|uniref:polysaccharide deacetylase family protein n=1 Tax=Paenibacillus mesophilus TaxID=2582849 RepID=UPI00110F0DE9|nr:polysaccharide deacetylase family protein [Paenibacillus mesophilus]TMV43048.1 hypothetical protein FE783_36455 [Paenibacillus mesophilus]
MKYRRWTMMLLCFGLTGNLLLSPAYAEHFEDDNLLARIKEEADKRYIPAINARIDHAWHAIPGYNGREVDIEKTYEIAQKNPNRIDFIYREIPPTVNLEQLGVEPIYRGNPGKPMVSIMVNVAWGDEYIPTILDVLEKEQVHATFFFDGSWLSKHMDMAKQIGERGHELSNHAYSHKNMSRLSKQQAIEEISKTEALLKQLHVQNQLFAPPSGDYSMETVRIAHALQLKTVLWTLDTVDWKHPSPESIVQKISNKVEPGMMILMHPTDSSSQALERMIKGIKQKGYVLGTVSDLLSTKRIPEERTSLHEEPTESIAN